MDTYFFSLVCIDKSLKETYRQAPWISAGLAGSCVLLNIVFELVSGLKHENGRGTRGRSVILRLCFYFGKQHSGWRAREKHCRGVVSDTLCHGYPLPCVPLSSGPSFTAHSAPGVTRVSPAHF